MKKIEISITIIVITCNLGQRVLLFNFIYSSRSKGLHMGNILVIETDVKKFECTQEIELAVFYDEVASNALFSET